MNSKEKENLQQLINALKAAKNSLKAAEKWAEKLGVSLHIPLESLEKLSSPSPTNTSKNGRVIEGIFDGQCMVDKEGNKYPIPANYISKSKLVEGDRLKLTIAENGAFIYKQIEQVPRKLAVGQLVLDGSQYQVLIGEKAYNVLYAAVTFYRAKVGDQITVILPKDKEASFAAIENVLPS